MKKLFSTAIVAGSIWFGGAGFGAVPTHAAPVPAAHPTLAGSSIATHSLHKKQISPDVTVICITFPDGYMFCHIIREM